jgi:hypothetical protein
MSYTPAANEVIGGIQNKLIVITDLFNFYQTIEDHDIGALFRNKTFDGLVGIIDDLIDKLEGLKIEKDKRKGS